MAKKKHGGEAHESDERWLITYADMITLLMVFFIVMFSMANTDLKNFEKVAQSLQVAFNVGGRSPAASLIGISSGATSSVGSTSAPVLFNSLPPNRRDFVRISSELTTYAQSLNTSGDISINMTTEGIIISLSEKLTFKPGETSLRPEVAGVLDKVSEMLQPLDNKIRIEGHTDNTPTNHPMYPTNWELSAQRAISVVRYLEDEGGITPERLQIAGNAEFKPLAPNDTRANRARNRRVDIIIIYPGESRTFSFTPPPS
jgi:chemotaxis protein MotB